MKDFVLRNAENYTSIHRRKARWRGVVSVLSAVVVFCTIYALTLPAVTMERSCPIPEHTHSDNCYAQVTTVVKPVPVCNTETLDIHRHHPSCYDAEGNCVCGYADFVVHRHDSACYDESGNFWCRLPQIEVHFHGAECYLIPEAEPQEVHVHTEDCYFLERGDLICTESTEPEHTHSPECYQEIKTLICGCAERSGHM